MTILIGHFSGENFMQITAAEFKAKCLKLMDEITKTREPIIITKRGKPIAKLMPADEQPTSLFGYMKGKGQMEIIGDIVGPLEVEWNAEKEADSYEDDELYGPLRPKSADHSARAEVSKPIGTKKK
jgi:prevent-host-death family protein